MNGQPNACFSVIRARARWGSTLFGCLLVLLLMAGFALFDAGDLIFLVTAFLSTTLLELLVRARTTRATMGIRSCRESKNETQRNSKTYKLTHQTLLQDLVPKVNALEEQQPINTSITVHSHLPSPQKSSVALATLKATTDCPKIDCSGDPLFP